MLYRISLLVLLFAILFPPTSFSQQLGGNKPSTKWKQINIAPAKIIFPAGLDSQAIAVAAQINYIANNKSFSLGDKLKQVPVVLQNQPILSNGYVGLGPFRSEFFMTAPADNMRLGSLPWARQLAIHEYRHVHQYTNFRKGLAGIGAVVFGQQTQALFNALTIPDWFFEGDAVFSETVYTAQGRGRVPYFLNEFKVLNSSSGKKPTFMQLRNGSLRHQYPNHYQFGYLMVAYGYEEYGQDFWKVVTEETNRIKGVFYPFQKAIKRNTGKNYSAFTAAALNSAMNNGAKPSTNKGTNAVTPNLLNKTLQANSLTTAPNNLLYEDAVRDKFVINYINPQAINEDSIIWLKRSTKSVAAFYLKSADRETKLTNRHLGNDEYFSYQNGKIIYTSTSVHPRWSWMEYSDLILYDIHKKTTEKLSHKKRYFSPAMNTEGTRIVVVENGIDGESRLQLLDANHRTVYKTISFPAMLHPHADGKGVFTFPAFYGDSAIVAALRFPDGQMALAYFALYEENIQLLTPLSYQVYSAPRINGDYLYSNVSLNGTDNIIRVQLDAMGAVEQLRQTEMIYNPIAVKDKLWGSKFTINGQKPVQLPFTDADWEQVPAESWSQLPTSYQLLNATPYTNLNQPTIAPPFPTERFAVSRYRAGSNLFNFHSWQPTFDDPDWGLTLYGQNVLNTFLSELSYKYNTNEHSHTASAAVIYAGLFPYIRANIDFTQNRNTISNNQHIRWNELAASLGLEIPLQLNGGNYYRSLSFRSSVNNQSLFITNKNQVSYSNSNFNFIRTGFTYSAQVAKTSQQIYPRFAHNIRFDWRKSINENNAQQFNTGANLYLPGLFLTHNLVFNAALQLRDLAPSYRFSNDFPTSRGYTDYNFYRMYKLGANYHLPLFYPEAGFANILYFLRVRANLFIDIAMVTDNFIVNNNPVITRKLSFDQNATGVEIYFDTKWWNQLPVSFGIRYSRLLNNDFFGRDPNQFEFILPIDLFLNKLIQLNLPATSNLKRY